MKTAFGCFVLISVAFLGCQALGGRFLCYCDTVMQVMNEADIIADVK